MLGKVPVKDRRTAAAFVAVLDRDTLDSDGHVLLLRGC
jgi:hypothetical protein